LISPAFRHRFQRHPSDAAFAAIFFAEITLFIFAIFAMLLFLFRCAMPFCVIHTLLMPRRYFLRYVDAATPTLLTIFSSLIY